MAKYYIGIDPDLHSMTMAVIRVEGGIRDLFLYKAKSVGSKDEEAVTRMAEVIMQWSLPTWHKGLVKVAVESQDVRLASL